MAPIASGVRQSTTCPPCHHLNQDSYSSSSIHGRIMRAIKDKQPDQQYNAITKISEKEEECVDKDSGQWILIF